MNTKIGAGLYHGDCLEVMKNIPDCSVDMVLTDPPYGITSCKWDSIIPLEPMWEQLNRIIKPDGAIVMTATQPFTTTLISSNIKNFKYCWYWKKNKVTTPLTAHKQPMRNIEDIVVFNVKTYYPQGLKKYNKFKKKHSGAIYNPIPKGSYEQKLTNYPTQFLEFSKDGVSRSYHPTQKPIELLKYLILTYTKEGETVLDFTMGSGSTGVACKRLNREFIGIELDEKYYKVACERLNNVSRPLF